MTCLGIRTQTPPDREGDTISICFIYKQNTGARAMVLQTKFLSFTWITFQLYPLLCLQNKKRKKFSLCQQSRLLIIFFKIFSLSNFWNKNKFNNWKKLALLCQLYVLCVLMMYMLSHSEIVRWKSLSPKNMIYIELYCKIIF